MASLHFAFLWLYSIPLMIWIRMLSLAHIYQDDSLLFFPTSISSQYPDWILAECPLLVGGVLKRYRSPQWTSMNATGGVSVGYYQSFLCAPIL